MAQVPPTSGDSTLGSVAPSGERTQPKDQVVYFETGSGATAHAGSRPAYRPFDDETRSFVYGLQPRAIQVRAL